MSKKLTPWFPASTAPHHRGVYEIVTAFKGPHFSYWDGKRFGYFTRTAGEAFLCRNSMKHGRFPWRGLAKKP